MTIAPARRLPLLTSLVFLGLGITALAVLHYDIWYFFVPLLVAPLILVLVAPLTKPLFWTRAMVMGLTVLCILGLSLTVQIVNRTLHGPKMFLHDGGVQTEAALDFLAAGQNPYAADYQPTAFGQFIDLFSQGERPNPAWTHYIYLPAHLVLSLPIQATVKAISNGWYDQRLVYVLANVMAAVFLMAMARRWGREWSLLIGLLFLFNPFWVPFFVFGFNDIFVFAFMAGSLWALARGRPLAAGIWFGFALASKQTSWLFVPFFVVYLFVNRHQLPKWRSGIVAAIVTAAVFLLPFFLWSPSNFIADTIQYPSGVLETSYPISGQGFSVWLYDQGFIQSIWDYYPFLWWQLTIAGPVLAGALWFLWRDKRLATAILGALFFAGVFWFFSRFFNHNYVTYLTFLLIAALALTGPAKRLRAG